MNSNNEYKDKRADEDKLDDRASQQKTDTERILAAVHSIGHHMVVTKRCLCLETKPVIDILSVRLLCNNNNNTRGEEPRKISGVISVFDDRGNICFIYKRDLVEDELDVIPVEGNGNYGTLSLNFSEPHDLMLMYSPDILVNIKDYITGEVIVKGCAQFSMIVDAPEEQDHPFEQFRTLTIPGNGNGCSAVVDYLVLTYGVFAHVEVKLCGSGNWGEEDDEEYFLIYGKISADYNLYHFEKRSHSITLFEIKEDSMFFERTTFDSPIDLSKSVVAVPAYSSLIVHVDLWSVAKKVPIVKGSFIFYTNNHVVDEVISGLDHTNAKITIDWKQPFNKICSTPTLTRWPRNPKLPYELCPPFGREWVEVFSVSVGRQNDKDLSLYGMINFDGGTVLTMFGRDKKDPYVLSRGCNFLPLQIINDGLEPSGITYVSVELEDVEGLVSITYVSVELEDVEGLVSIKGVVTIDLRSSLSEAWYDRLLCAVIKGVDNRSFAAVHYTVFSDARRAKVEVQFHSESERFTNACISIHGSMVFRYGEYGIRTQYERMYHRCLLFKRHKDNPLKVFGNDFDLELLRSIAVVPCNSSAIMEVDLSCCLSTGFTTYLRETKRFQIGTENVTIDGDEFSLRIAIKWR